MPDTDAVRAVLAVNTHPLVLVCIVLAVAAVLWLVALLTFIVLGDSLFDELLEYVLRHPAPA